MVFFPRVPSLGGAKKPAGITSIFRSDEVFSAEFLGLEVPCRSFAEQNTFDITGYHWTSVDISGYY